MRTVELLEELDAFDPRWREAYKSLAHAAEAAGIGQEFSVWVQETEDGRQYAERYLNVHDYQADNDARRAAIEAERRMQRAGRVQQGRGYLLPKDAL